MKRQSTRGASVQHAPRRRCCSPRRSPARRRPSPPMRSPRVARDIAYSHFDAGIRIDDTDHRPPARAANASRRAPLPSLRCRRYGTLRAAAPAQSGRMSKASTLQTRRHSGARAAGSAAEARPPQRGDPDVRSGSSEGRAAAAAAPPRSARRRYATISADSYICVPPFGVDEPTGTAPSPARLTSSRSASPLRSWEIRARGHDRERLAPLCVRTAGLELVTSSGAPGAAERPTAWPLAERASVAADRGRDVRGRGSSSPLWPGL